MKRLFGQVWTQEQVALGVVLGAFILAKLMYELGAVSLLFMLLQKIVQFLGRILRFKDKEGGIELGGLFIRDLDRVRHSEIIGPPGSGKTELTKLLVFEDLKRGRGCFIIDPKGDRELYDEIRVFCQKIGREQDLKLISATFPQESVCWNPCGLGNASELQSKFLNSNLYTEAHYAKACELALLQAFNILAEAKPSGFGLKDLVRELEALAQRQKSKDLDGLFYDFGSLSQSEWAPILGGIDKGKPKEEISLLDIVLKNQILFVHLPTEGKSIQSSRVGRLLTQELILISGLKKNFPVLNKGGVFSVFIDEFDAFATESFVTFLNKGRSSNFMIHIAHQTMSDLRRISLEYAGQILGNCNTHFIFRQDNPDDADFWSRFFGTKAIIKRTYQTQDGMQTGASSNREVKEFKISPDDLRSLEVGQCIVSIKTQQLAKRVRLPLPPRHSGDAEPNEIIADILKQKQRGLTSLKEERTPSEEARDLSPEQFETILSHKQFSSARPSGVQQRKKHQSEKGQTDQVPST